MSSGSLGHDSSISPDPVVRAWEALLPGRVFEASFRFAGVPLLVRTDDPALLDELVSAFGAARSCGEAGHDASLSVLVRCQGGPAHLGYLRFDGNGDHAHTPDDFRLGAASPDFPFAPVESADPSWTHVAFRGESIPLFSLKGRHCLFRQDADWRVAVGLLLFHRVLRLRHDAIFFHAAAVGIRGQGILIVGPRGAGKSTTALALAGRGHDLLADDTAGYVLASRELIPCRRSVGIRPGPRAKAVDLALARLDRDPSREGFVRVAVDALMPGPAPVPVPLAGVAFLRGFAPHPELSRVEPGREELAGLLPVVGSLVNAPATRRVFEMVRLLSAVPVYHLRPGDPDLTAALLEEVVSPCA